MYDLGGGRDNCMLNVAYECRDGGGFEAWEAQEHGQREVRHIMRNRITLGSLFDGSGGFPLAGCMCGIEPLWASEIEPYPIAVTKARFPRMKHFGDVQKISGAGIDPVDVITFGSPCQDMSIAGKRAGLRHEENGDDHTTRSGLFIEAIRIIREMRQATNGKYPAFAVWENVPGAFSSNGGADFKTVLEELASVAQGEHVSVPFPEKRKWLNAGEIVGDGFSIAWRVLDAQYWGVPQRRKRIYLVADFAGGRAATSILATAARSARQAVRIDARTCAKRRKGKHGARQLSARSAHWRRICTYGTDPGGKENDESCNSR